MHHIKMVVGVFAPPPITMTTQHENNTNAIDVFIAKVTSKRIQHKQCAPFAIWTDMEMVLTIVYMSRQRQVHRLISTY